MNSAPGNKQPPQPENRPAAVRVSEAVEGALYRKSRLIEHVGVDHCRCNIPVPQQLLHGADIVARFEPNKEQLSNMEDPRP